jgi:hypothetical protein
MSQQSTKEQSINWILSCIDKVEAKYPVDKHAVFLFGFSQGGMLTYEIGVRYASRFRGLIPVGGLLDFKFDSLHQFDTACRHVPLLALHGVYDDVVEFKADMASRETLRNRGMCADVVRFPAKREITREMIEDARDSLIYLPGARGGLYAESLITSVMKDHWAPSNLRQTAYSALVKLATPTAWQTVKTTRRVVCANRLVVGGNGEKAGLKPDDVILSYNGRKVKKTSDLRDAISTAKPDTKAVALVVEREGKRLTLRLPPGRVGVYLSERVK